MTEIVAAFLGALGSIILAIITYLGAKKLGIGQNQEKLVSTLKDLISAQEGKIDNLNELITTNNTKIGEMAMKIDKLQELTISQAAEISSLLSLISDNQSLKEIIASRHQATPSEKNISKRTAMALAKRAIDKENSENTQ